MRKDKRVDAIVLDTLKQTGIRSLPVDIDYWYKCKGWQHFSYDQVKRDGAAIHRSRNTYSHGTEAGAVIYYDDTVRSAGRVRWMLAQEGARLILGKGTDDKSVDHFVNTLLIPFAPLVHLKMESADSVMRMFDVPREKACARLKELRLRRFLAEQSAGFKGLDLEFLRQFRLE